MPKLLFVHFFLFGIFIANTQLALIIYNKKSPPTVIIHEYKKKQQLGEYIVHYFSNVWEWQVHC